MRDGRVPLSTVTLCSGCWERAAWWLLSPSPFASPHARQVFPPGQPSWLDQTYRGSFTCRVWQFGRWVEVTIDDRLPCLAGRLCFSRCQREDVFWLPLLEKVYAKYARWGRRGRARRAGGPGSTSARPGLQRPCQQRGPGGQPWVGRPVQRQKL